MSNYPVAGDVGRYQGWALLPCGATGAEMEQPAMTRMPKRSPFRIAVLSDQHIDSEVEPDSWELAKAAFTAAAKTKADHIVIVGDTFDCATAMLRDRDRVERYLRKLGLWHRDRLTVVVGNHDIFHTPHHGTFLQKGAELARIALADGQESYDAFCEWAGELVSAGDRLDDDDLYPIAKELGGVRLWATDTTAKDTSYSANGFFRRNCDNLLRANSSEGEERRILAIHHAPFESEKREFASIPEYLREGWLPAGFPRPSYRRLERFVDDAEVDAVVCGHIHEWDESYNWKLGDKWEADVHLVGRTGSVHDEKPCFGVLEAPATGKLGWKMVRF